MFELMWVETAKEQYEDLKRKAESAAKTKGKKRATKTSRAAGLFKQVHKALTLLASNAKHPGLQTHEFESIENPFKKGEKVFEAYAQNQTPGAYRIFWCYGPKKGQITIIAITPHP